MADGYEYVRMYTAQTDTNMPTRKEGRFDKRRVFFRRDGFCLLCDSDQFGLLVYGFPGAQFLSHFRLLVFKDLADYLLACEKKKGPAQNEDEKKDRTSRLRATCLFFFAVT